MVSLLSLNTTGCSAVVLFFLFLCLVLAESCPALPFPGDPDVVFPECCDPDDGAVCVGGDVFSGDSR